MGKQEKYYWHGKGVILIGGVRYSVGKEIPADKLDKKRLATFLESGDVSTAEVDVKPGASETVLDAKYRELKKAYDKIINEKKAGGKCKDCSTKDKRIVELDDGVKVAIERADTLDADVKEKAALIEKQAARITELEAQIEELTKPNGGGQ